MEKGLGVGVRNFISFLAAEVRKEKRLKGKEKGEWKVEKKGRTKCRNSNGSK